LLHRSRRVMPEHREGHFLPQLEEADAHVATSTEVEHRWVGAPEEPTDTLRPRTHRKSPLPLCDARGPTHVRARLHALHSRAIPSGARGPTFARFWHAGPTFIMILKSRPAGIGQFQAPEIVPRGRAGSVRHTPLSPKRPGSDLIWNQSVMPLSSPDPMSISHPRA
jgi:hypothetical protein